MWGACVCGLKVMIYNAGMKRTVMTSLVLLLAFFCLSAVETSGNKNVPLEVALSGKVSAEDLTIQLVMKETRNDVSAIAFDDLFALNTYGFIVSHDIYSLVYSYISAVDSSVSVKLEVSSKGLSADGGETYPIGISFVTADSDSEKVDWASKTITISDTAEFETYQSFRIRLDNKTLYSIQAGLYSGTINFQLVSE